jgi:hypothetical protein
MTQTNDDHYSKLSTKVKRGQGTRDQDTTKVTTRHPDPEQAVENHNTAVEHAKQFAGHARTIQPDEEDVPDAVYVVVEETDGLRSEVRRAFHHEDAAEEYINDDDNVGNLFVTQVPLEAGYESE